LVLSSSIRRLVIVVTTSLALFFLTISQSSGYAYSASRNSDLEPRVLTTGRILVKFRSGTDASKVLQSASIQSGIIVDRVNPLGVKVVRPRTVLAQSLGALERLANHIEQNPSVIYAQPEVLLQPQDVTPNDPDYSRQWGLQRIRAPKAWEISTGSSTVKIGIVDSGIAMNHPELKDRYAGGYDFVQHDTYPQDTDGHGTHVAGIAAATGNNGIGIAGVGWRTKLLVARVLTAEGATDTDVAKGIIWVTDHGASVINISLGTYYDSDTLHQAIQYAQEKGVLVVAAAGNESTNIPLYPAAYPGVIGVAATNQDDRYASFSNYGSYVDISAPGVDIYSTYPGGYAYMSGTSMAAPFVTGAAAVIKAEFPWYSANQIWQRLKAGADDLGPQGLDTRYGYGRLNLYRSLAVPGTLIGRVRNAKTGNVLPGVRVQLYGTPRYTYTDSQGRFVFRNIRYGAGKLIFSKQGYAQGMRNIFIEPAATEYTGIRLAPLARLSGYVRSSSGTPLSNAVVSVTSQEGSDLQDATDSYGRYFIKNVPIGIVRVTASLKDYTSVTKNVSTTMGTTTSVSFTLKPLLAPGN